MRSLHVAALPFPTQQGTQAAIHAMVSALDEAGHESELLCYAHGAPGAAAPRYALHRLDRTWGLSSLRSGPSLGKLGLDLLLARRLRERVAARPPDRIFAHHVEAALACMAAGVARFVFVAHTSLRAELAYYFAPGMRGACQRAGGALDRFLCRGATRVFAVSPLLARALSSESGRSVQALRVPWPVPSPTSAQERARARRALGLGDEHELVLYAGNLDAYQGLPVLLDALGRLAARRPALRFLLATETRGTSALLAHARRRVPTLVLPLAEEAHRRRAHAAADVVAVPRASEGGLPIKLLDALARGAHVVAARRAAAGLPLGAVCSLVRDDDSAAFAGAIDARLSARDRAPSARARAYIEREHTKASFFADLRAGLCGFDGESGADERSFSEPPGRGDKVPRAPSAGASGESDGA